MPSPSVPALLAAALIAAAHGSQAQDIRVTLPIVVAEGGAHSDPQAAAPAKAASTTTRKTCRRKRDASAPPAAGQGRLRDRAAVARLGRFHHRLRTPRRAHAGGEDPAHRQSRPVVRMGRPLVQVPIEAVAILARQIDLLDISREEFRATPVWSAAATQPIPPDEMITIAITRR